MPYRSTKTYGHNLGLSACFRQHRAESHCKYLHGYALAFSFVFEALQLDKNGWVVDFGSLKPLKEKLVATFDHKVVIANDDPQRMIFETLASDAVNLADVLVLPGGVGCEAFARLAWGHARDTIHDMKLNKRVTVISCECREHGANSAIYLASQEERYA